MTSMIRKLIYRHFKRVTPQALLALVVFYVLISWSLLWASGEQALVSADFLYWLVVTSSTVGYGDLSPSGHTGKLVTALFIIPVGLSLFAICAGKVATFGVNQWRKGIMGGKSLDLDNHILVLGWDPQRTANLLRLLGIETGQNLGRKICLCVTDEMENPLPGEVEFVRINSFNDDEGLDRACIHEASTIIIDTQADDSTLTAALYAAGRNPDAHLIAYFRDESLSKLLQHHCPQAECTPSVSTEMLVKAAMDPGSSRLHQELLNASQGMTQYSVRFPSDQPSISVATIYNSLKLQYGVTLLAVADQDDNAPLLNPPLEYQIEPGSLIYYIADQRIHRFDWLALLEN